MKYLRLSHVTVTGEFCCIIKTPFASANFTSWLPANDSGLVLVSCLAFMACWCFSKAASMSPRSNSTDALLFFPATLVNASFQVRRENEKKKKSDKCQNNTVIDRGVFFFIITCSFFCSMLISEYSCAVAKAAARAFFLWLLALFGTDVVIGMGVCTMLMGEFSERLSSCGEHRDCDETYTQHKI